jgi:hypothetical protein
VIEELFPVLEVLEAQNAAILQFLKDRGIASDNDLAPFLKTAANASSVRWRAARIRMNHHISSAAKAIEVSQEKSRQASEANKDQEAKQEPAAGHTDSEEKTGANSSAGKDGDSGTAEET